jgi:predicted HTH transcriptional regulator
MPFYTTALSQLTMTDLQELLSEQAVENLRLEFKLKIPDKSDTLKKLSSFANTFGGFMVVGAGADTFPGPLIPGCIMVHATHVPLELLKVTIPSIHFGCGN